MKIKAWGTRGSMAISNPRSRRYGGNSTCYEVLSECVPSGTKLMIDAGTGLVPAGHSYLPEIKDGLRYELFFTHYHWDHILGLTIAPPTFVDDIPMSFYGPIDNGVCLKQMLNHLFQRPYFPVEAASIHHKINFTSFNNLEKEAVLVHPEAGFQCLLLADVHSSQKNKEPLCINGIMKPLQECLLITLSPTNHGNAQVISYRFEELPTGRIFVFCTDHDNMQKPPKGLYQHFSGANLAIIDGQYDTEKYEKFHADYGHGTAAGAVRLALATGVERLGITHHDPMQDDEYLESMILVEAQQTFDDLSQCPKFHKLQNLTKVALDRAQIFLCGDYEVYEV
jgi:phosphoribosyl 1,2-cyclic phosphodiesterase